MTKLNTSILNLIQESKEHLTAEEVFMLAKEQEIDVSLASVYRILNKLTNEGLISRFTNNNQVDVFDKTIYQHAHLICQKCGEIKDFEIANFKDEIVKNTNINDLKRITLTVEYICEKCQNKNG